MCLLIEIIIMSLSVAPLIMASSSHGFMTGVSVTMVGQSLIGLAFATKRWISTRDPQNTKGFFARLWDWRFWVSALLLLLGESCNFVGYLFMPAYVMVMLGATGLVVAQISSAVFLKEYLSSVHILGTLVIVSGAALVIGMTPTSPDVGQITHFNDAAVRWMDSLPLMIIVASMVTIATFTFLVIKIQRIRSAEKYRSSTMKEPQSDLILVVYALSGSLSVITTKGVGILLKEAIVDDQLRFNNAMSYLIWPWWLLLIVSQILLINWLLHHNELSSISPLMYATYAICGTFSSLVYYREIGSHTTAQLMMTTLGFAMLLTGVWMITRSYPRDMGFWPWCSPRFPRRVTKTDDLPDEPLVEVTFGSAALHDSDSMSVSVAPREEQKFRR